jgi:hypothetical protein
MAARCRYAHILNQKLGKPLADVKVSIAKWPTANCTYTTPKRPKPGRGLETVGCLLTRSFASGTKVGISVSFDACFLSCSQSFICTLARPCAHVPRSVWHVPQWDRRTQERMSSR